MFDAPRNNLCEHAILQGGYQSDEDRDESATLHSTYDIAWVGPGRERISSH